MNAGLPVASMAKSPEGSGPAQAWVRALEMTAPIARYPQRIFPHVIEERAAQFGDAPALLSDRESLTYGALAERANRYSRWALAQGIVKGDCVGLLMPNRPEYMACWLGIAQVGGVVALLNTNQRGASLAHSIDIVAPKHLIVAEELRDALTGPGNLFSDLQLADGLKQYSGEALTSSERPRVTIADRALYIFTSGTTGLPKAATISHGRVMQWCHWFAGLMNTQPADRMYNCLPMYHSVGGVQAPGAMLAAGGSVVLREKFSASRFWDDIVRWDCTLVQYIGELCRYLLRTEPSAHAIGHRIRMACGNGLRPEVWNAFQTRFRIPRILEFYAATEGNVSLFNVEGEPGSIGRIPPYLAHRFPAALIRFDVEKGEPVRDEQGFCIRCQPNEVGEAIGRIINDTSNVGGRFEGYTSPEATEKKIVRGVFEPGDAWFRTGDLMRKDARGFFYFVDRIGDTFRWKGENVATLEVAEALCAFPGITEANVYGVTVPGADGRAGMATLVAAGEPDLRALSEHLEHRLPEYARPQFLRIRSEMEVTGTFKYTKTDLVRQGYDPGASSDRIFFYDPQLRAFLRLDQAMYERIQNVRAPHYSSGQNQPIQAKKPQEFQCRHLSAKTSMQNMLESVRSAAETLHAKIAAGPIVPRIMPEEIRSHLARYNFTAPLALSEVCADVDQMLRAWQVQVTHPRYFGLFNPSVTPASIVGDTLAAMYNPQLATWRTSPAANEIERHTLAWLASKFGFPADASASFTSGGSEANFSAVIIALTRAHPLYGENGVGALDATPAIYVTAEANHSFNKIAHMAGLGRRALRVVGTDCLLRMDVRALALQVAQDRKNGLAPLMVAGTAGTTAAGVIDPLPELARFCLAENLWFHVDAAWGGAAILSPVLKAHLGGIEAADSITCDAHKWLSVPMGAGMLFCRHPEAVGAAFHAETTYMPAQTAGPVSDPYTTSAQWSRRFIGLKLFLALAERGESGYAEMIEHQARMGELLRKSLQCAGWRIVNSTPLPVVCFTRDGLDHAQFVAALHQRQIAWMSECQLSGAPAVRACITSFRTTEQDIEWVVREMSGLCVR
jgi:fatty-acyl-CoA synthase